MNAKIGHDDLKGRLDQGEHRTLIPPTEPSATTSAIACSLDEAGAAARADTLRHDLFAAVEETRELADGYAFRFPGAEEWMGKLLAFVDAERRCCSFFRFELTFEPNLGPIWLRLGGPEGVKPFVREMAGMPA